MMPEILIFFVFLVLFMCLFTPLIEDFIGFLLALFISICLSFCTVGIITLFINRVQKSEIRELLYEHLLTVTNEQQKNLIRKALEDDKIDYEEYRKIIDINKSLSSKDKLKQKVQIAEQLQLEIKND